MTQTAVQPHEDLAKGIVLVVDDNPNNLSVLCGMLEEAGYKARPAINGELALRSARLSAPDLILLDIRMPEMDGYEVCRRLRAIEQTREIPIIFISALQETDDKVRAFKEGGIDYIVKPFQLEEVLARVNTHVTLHRTQIELRRAYDEMEERVEQRTRELVLAREEQYRLTEQFKNSLCQTIDAIALALEKRDPYTAGHQQHVSDLAVALARRLNVAENDIEGIRLGAMIHDIGKIYIPAEILGRPGPLSPVEYKLVKTHAEVGYEIVRGIDFPWPIAEMVRQHHERLDGSGYPRGLQGNEILWEARIIAVADVIDAISSHRPYRPSLGLEAALREVEAGRGLLYDSAVVDAALALYQEGKIEASHAA